jgi:hypothetical protein
MNIASVRRSCGATAIFTAQIAHREASLEIKSGSVSRPLPRGDVGSNWSVSGANYDEAFRNAVRGAARALSGNGEPL